MRSPAAEEELGKGAMIHNAQQQQQPRRKGIGTRVWLVVSESGQCRTEEVGKHSIMRRTGLPARDLRVLDPMLSYPSTILGRERAIVLNLEHIKAIITAKEVLMINSTNPLVVQFIHDLRDRIHDFNVPPPPPPLKTEEALALWDSSFETHENVNASSDTVNNGINSSSRSQQEAPVAPSPKLLPFEFKALEVCLESACRCLECETQTLEEEAYPALDELTSRVSTLNLERVRQIKSRLVAISGRVQKVRDELEHLLDDDNDMAEMYLTEKLNQRVEQVSLGGESDDEGQDEGDERAEDSNSEHSSEIYSGFKPNVEDLEMLLEAYFAQIDGIQQKLGNMREYVDDTEDYINIMLDDKQNQLLQMGVMLSTSNMILNAGIVVVGLFGMNITNELFSAPTYKFWEAAIGTVAGCVGLYLIAIAWGKSRNLI